MKKVLFIAYDFPPCKSIGGALRSAEFVKYLPEFGWKPYVLALKNQSESGQDVIRIPSATPYHKPYEVSPYGWTFSVYNYAKKEAYSSEIDLIYVTCPPFPQSISALLLKKRLNCPLVVDFRDAWSLDPYCEGSKLKRFMYKKVFPLFEKIVLKGADVFITNTASMSKAYQQTYPFLQGKTVLIPNGFNENDFTEASNSIPITQNKLFTLTYCGRFGIGGRDPRLILKSIQSFIHKNGNVIRFEIIGDNSALIQQYINEYELIDNVSQIATVPHNKSLDYMNKADVLLLYQENTPAQVSAIAGKTYEYLRTGKAILGIVPEGDNHDIVKRYASSYELVNEYSEQAITSALQRLYTKFKQGDISSISVPKKDYLKNYNRRFLTQQLAEKFDSVSGLG